MRTIAKFAALALLVAAQQASAISLTFKFKVNSSGPSIYACNAGLMSPRSDRRVCYFEGTKNSCTPTCAPGDNACKDPCVCTSRGGGEYLMNYGNASYSGWQETGDPNKSFVAGQDSFNQLFTDSEAWGKSLKTLSFNLGSELYTSKYFVDVCFRGPQIEYFSHDHSQNVPVNWDILAQVTGSDFGPNGIKYSELADLKVSAYVTCDKQGQGQYQYANVNGHYDTLANEADFYLWNHYLPVGGGDFFKATSPQSLNTNSGVLYHSSEITDQDHKSLRFCKVRYMFEERDGGSSKPNFRKWQHHGAELCTYTEFNEAKRD